MFSPDIAFLVLPISFFFLVIPTIAIATRAPASTAPAPPTAATTWCAAADAAAVARASAAAFGAGVGRRAHKGEVNVDGLVEELGVVGAVDGGAGLVEGGVLDKRVALLCVGGGGG